MPIRDTHKPRTAHSPFPDTLHHEVVTSDSTLITSDSVDTMSNCQCAVWSTARAMLDTAETKKSATHATMSFELLF